MQTALARRAETDAADDLAADLAHFASGLDPARLPEAVRAAVRVNILDTLACAVAGSTGKAVAEVAGLVAEWGGARQAGVWVLGGRFPAHHAAWVNGTMAHARDYDDTHDAAVLHAGVSAVPAALAAAELAGGISGAELIAAVAAGLETTCRLGLATQIGIIESGFIYTSLLGYFGATAAAGRALRLSPEQMRSAFGIVYSSVAGNHQVTRDASLMKRMQPGLAAQAAVLAVQLAQRGIEGPRNTFEGLDGFFRVYLRGRCDPAIVRHGLGESFELLNLSYKPYPCCRYNHTAIDATLEVRRGRPASEIESIRVGVNRHCYEAVCTPQAVRWSPQTIVEAQFSIPFTVAAAWIDGAVGLRQLTDQGLQRQDILALAKFVLPCVDAAIERDWARNISPAKLSIWFRDGTSAEARVDYPKGHPRHPMTPADFASKLEDCATFSARPFGPERARALMAAVEGLDSALDIKALIGALA